MLQIAKNKYIPNKNENIEFKKGGFPGCGLERNSIDIFIAINGPFMYLNSLNEQISALNDLYLCLRNGGLVFIDINNFSSLIQRYETPKILEFETDNQRIICINQHDNFSHKEQWVHTFNIFIEDKSGEIKKIVSKHGLKMISPTEMRLLLMKVNFIDIEITVPPSSEECAKSRIRCFARKP